jgi:hydroxymethylbilane synthase
MKDLPTRPYAGITLAAVPARGDSRDALVARPGQSLAELPTGATVGTGSPRRAAQLRMLRPDLVPIPIRGNAETRLAMVSDGRLDAVVLGYAGLGRIGRLDAVSQVFSLEQMLPAPGQGALAVECRASASDLTAVLAAIDDPGSRAAVTAERSLLTALEGGCLAPVGAYASGAAAVHLRALVAAPDGAEALRESSSGPPGDAESLGRELAARLLDRGAGRLVADNESRHSSQPLDRGPVRAR